MKRHFQYLNIYLNILLNKPEAFCISSTGRFRDTECIEAKGTAHTLLEQDIMTFQATYRGLPFQSQSFETVETIQQGMFLGRKANIVSPIKSPVILPADIRFFGRQATAVTTSKNIVMDLSGLVPA